MEGLRRTPGRLRPGTEGGNPKPSKLTAEAVYAVARFLWSPGAASSFCLSLCLVACLPVAFLCFALLSFHFLSFPFLSFNFLFFRLFLPCAFGADKFEPKETDASPQRPKNIVWAPREH